MENMDSKCTYVSRFLHTHTPVHTRMFIFITYLIKLYLRIGRIFYICLFGQDTSTQYLHFSTKSSFDVHATTFSCLIIGLDI